MAVTAYSIVSIAFFIAKIYGRGFTNLTPTNISDGVSALNDILAEKSVDDSLNPYYATYAFDTEPNVETYFIPDLVECDTLTYEFQTLRLPMEFVSRDQYRGSIRANGIDSLPQIYFVERVKGGANLSMYFFPNQIYPFELVGKFALTTAATPYTDLSLYYDPFYLAYLKAAIALRLCIYYGTEPTQQLLNLMKYYDITMANQISPPDLSVSKISTLGKNNALNWGVINIANTGFYP